MGNGIWAFPCGSGYPLYLFCLYRTKKDAAAIPNATFKRTPRFNELFFIQLDFAHKDTKESMTLGNSTLGYRPAIKI